MLLTAPRHTEESTQKPVQRKALCKLKAEKPQMSQGEETRVFQLVDLLVNWWLLLFLF